MAKKAARRGPGRPRKVNEEINGSAIDGRTKAGRAAKAALAAETATAAPRPRGRPRKMAEDTTAAPETTKKKAFPLISRRDLNALLEQCLIFQSRVSTAAGNMGELVRDYAQKKHLHRGAFSSIKGLVRMGHRDPGKLWLHLAHFDDMRAKCGLDKLAQEQGQLLPAIAEDTTGLEPPKSAENVVTYPQPRSVDERAGESIQGPPAPENMKPEPIREELSDVLGQLGHNVEHRTGDAA